MLSVSVPSIMLVLLSATVARAQWEGAVSVGRATPQGAAKNQHRSGETMSITILRHDPTQFLGFGLDVSVAKLHGKAVLGLGGPFKTADVSIWTVGIVGEVADRNAAVSPLLGAGLGFAGVKESDENRSEEVPTLNGVAGLRTRAGPISASVGVSHRIILYAASDTEPLRYSTIFAGARVRF